MSEHQQTPSFEARVAGRRVDLLDRIKEGIPAISYLPASDGRLISGRRHQWVAPKKTGKSIGALVHTVDMALAGATVIVFDRENGADLYARRLEGIIAARGLNDEQQRKLRRGLAYYEFPRLYRSDAGELVELCAGADLVIFDSQRMFLTDLGVGEDKSDDYAIFMLVMIDPLFQAGIATLVLDNSGHSDPKRGRGSSSKGDLQEILFALEEVEPFDLYTAGRLRLTITDSRFGNTGSWELEIGGGTFGCWRPADHAAHVAAEEAQKLSGYMTRVSDYMARHPAKTFSRNQICAAVTGGRAPLLRAISELVEGEYLSKPDGSDNVIYVKKYTPVQVVPTGSLPVPGTTSQDRFPGSPHKGNQEPGTTNGNHQNGLPVPRTVEWIGTASLDDLERELA